MPLMLAVVHLLTGCKAVLGAPVPSHPPIENTWRQVFEQRPLGLEPWSTPEDDVVYGGRERWGITRESAAMLERAQRPSEVARAWGAFVPTCANCHAGDPAQLPIEGGHGGAYLRLIEGVRVADAGLRQQAALELQGAPDLGPSHERIRQLFDRIAEHDDPAVHSQSLAALQHECWRCHGTEGLRRSR